MPEEEILTSEQVLQVPYNYSAGPVASRFLLGLRDEQRIYGIKCESCNTVYCPPRSVCGRCFLSLSEWVEVGPEGVLASFTKVSYHEDVHPRTPLVLGLIKPDGADTALTHLVLDKPEGLKPGDRVRAVFAEERSGHILDLVGFERVGG
ncbi:MAG: Zn-ribbon domain-containing OB-fold protein [bacterium]